MTFFESISVCFSDYGDFRRRAMRSEYWNFYAFNFLIEVVAGLIDFSFDTFIFEIVTFLVLLVPLSSVTVRRMHDLDKSAWWLLIGFIPFAGSIVLLFWTCSEGTEGENNFGPEYGDIGLDEPDYRVPGFE